MQTTLYALLALLLSACAANAPQPAPSQPIEARAAGGLVMIGTLAPFGSWEFELAPSYTRSASLRARAESKLDRHKISSTVAINVQALCDHARALLDEAAADTVDGVATIEARGKLTRANAALDKAAALMEPVHAH